MTGLMFLYSGIIDARISSYALCQWESSFRIRASYWIKI
jgi:hypothetical protein